VQNHLENAGVNIILSCEVQKFDSNKAILDSGENIDFDILIIATGVRPNINLLMGSAEVERGIVVNGRSETSAPDIFDQPSWFLG
jgi:NAD(P)H-nitrite reductase large subunit